MNSKLFFSLDKIKPQKSFAAGNLTCVTGDEVPGFANISFASLTLNKRGSLEPIWHPNADKVGYCTQGEGMVSIRSPGGVEMFTITDGEVFFIPQGYIHHVENAGSTPLVVNFALNNTKPEVMRLSNAVCSLSDPVFTATFGLKGDFLNGLKKNPSQDLIKTLSSKNGAPDYIASRYKFDIRESSKPVLTKGGFLQLATKTNLPVLEGLGILGFGLTPGGVVEPHWHTNAGELVFIVKGQTLITVLSPDGNVETLQVNAGQGAFAPASYFHNIENVGKEDVEVIAFFSNAEPDYIGLGEVVGSYSNELLSSVFNTDPHYFDTLKKTESPLVIVPIA